MENTRATRSRKRQKVSHADDNTEDSSTLPSKSVNKAKVAKADKMEAAQAATGSKEHGVLEEDLESMRHLISCKICQRFLTEPYGLACGHTYCYICLDSWLVTQRKNTCPECRAEVKQQPVPSLIIREMVNIFSTKQELLPEGESMEDLKKNAVEAATKVANDKTNIAEGGLFKGMFTSMGRVREAFYDAEDNVHRCPMCGHEIEDGMCSGCGLPIGDVGAWTDQEEEAEFDDFEGGYETEDIFPQFSTRIMGENALRSLRQSNRRHRALHRAQPDLEGFVVPDDEPEPHGQEDDSGNNSPEVGSRARSRRSRPATRSSRSNNAGLPIILSDSDSDDTSVAVLERPAPRQNNRRSANLATSGRRQRLTQRNATTTRARIDPVPPPSESSDSSPLSSDTTSSEEEAPIPRGRQARKSRNGGILLPPQHVLLARTSDAESDSESDSSNDSVDNPEDDVSESTDSQLSSDTDTNSDSSDSTATATHNGYHQHPFDDEQHNAVLAASLRLHGIQSEDLSSYTSDDDDY
ncbi:hypothetical protein AMS68_005632 [Peltaster fructicola]|uniref:RING-type domain-containing protein n=1 Tax=Peltaster fructicola TaxID=286661 RepID=A0A6H0XZM2_9PEZI|nr:hypothetical protein AMS68_005632 [Peltaster fructicola]